MSGGKRGRPPGKKDAKPRAGGRWSKKTREKHGAPPKAPPKAQKQGAAREEDQPDIGNVFRGSGAAAVQQSDGSPEAAAVGEQAVQDNVTDEPPCNDAAQPAVAAEQAGGAPRPCRAEGAG